MENNYFVTNDMSFTAYVIMRGCKLVDARKLGTTYKFTLDLGDEVKNRLQADYMNSDVRRFDAAVRDLKKIMFSGG